MAAVALPSLQLSWCLHCLMRVHVDSLYHPATLSTGNSVVAAAGGRSLLPTTFTFFVCCSRRQVLVDVHILPHVELSACRRDRADFNSSVAAFSRYIRTSRRLSALAPRLPSRTQLAIAGFISRYCSQIAMNAAASSVWVSSAVPDTITCGFRLSASCRTLWTAVYTSPCFTLRPVPSGPLSPGLTFTSTLSDVFGSNGFFNSLISRCIAAIILCRPAMSLCSFVLFSVTALLIRCRNCKVQNTIRDAILTCARKPT